MGKENRCCDASAKASSCSCSSSGKTILVYSCSGGANTGEVADRAARELMYSGCASVWCLAGLGADIQGMIQTAKDADLNLVIDGCPIDCAKKVFDRTGVTNYRHFRVTDLGIEKAKGVPCTREQVDKVVTKAREILAENSR